MKRASRWALAALTTGALALGACTGGTVDPTPTPVVPTPVSVDCPNDDNIIGRIDVDERGQLQPDIGYYSGKGDAGAGVTGIQLSWDRPNRTLTVNVTEGRLTVCALWAAPNRTSERVRVALSMKMTMAIVPEKVGDVRGEEVRYFYLRGNDPRYPACPDCER